MRDAQPLEAKYSQILRDREKHAGQSVEEFCRDKGINPCTYYYWKKRLRKTSEISANQKNFLPVDITIPPASSVNGGTAITYEIGFPNGVAMRLSGALHHADHSIIIGAVARLRP